MARSGVQIGERRSFWGRSFETLPACRVRCHRANEHAHAQLTALGAENKKLQDQASELLVEKLQGWL